MAASPPHIHTGSDSRFRVWDGERFVAIYEADDYPSASAHLARLQPKPRRRAAEPAPREVVLDLSSIPAARRGATEINAEDPERVHLKQFSDGWRVWNPLSRSYVGNADRGAFAAKTDAMFRARDLAVEAGLAGRSAPFKATKRRVASVEGGGLFAAREMAAPGQQIGLKFNASPAVVAVFTNDIEGVRALVSRSTRAGEPYAVSMQDVDSGERLPTVFYYADLDRAISQAKSLVFGREMPKHNQRLQGRRGLQPEVMPLYADVMAMGRATSKAELPPRRRTVAEYDAMSALRPNAGRKARNRLAVR